MAVGHSGSVLPVVLVPAVWSWKAPVLRSIQVHVMPPSVMVLPAPVGHVGSVEPEEPASVVTRYHRLTMSIHWKIAVPLLTGAPGSVSHIGSLPAVVPAVVTRY